VLNRLSINSGAIAVARFVPIVLVLCVFGCGGSASPNIVPPPSRAATPTFSPSAGSYTGTQTVTITSSTSGAILCWNTTGSPATNGTGTGCTTGISLTNGGSITVSVSETVYAVGGTSSLGDSIVGSAAYVITASVSNSFGFQCSVNSAGCPYNGTDYTWPTTQAQPGVLRLWDASVQWNVLSTASGTYNWNDMDQWLDAIAANTPRAVIYTFGWTPFWDAPSGSPCQTESTRGSPCPPTDLTSSGSPTFNAFVTALVAHCSPAGNCVSTYIKYFELWNEADTSVAWTGTVAQLYQMLAPAVSIITGAVSGVQILGPPLSDNTGTSVAWECSWLAQEVSNGVLSNIYAFHVYMQNNTPETRLANALPQLSPNTSYSSTCSASGWTAQPSWLTETNYANSSEPNPYACYTALYNTNDCIGQIVRWQLLLNSNDVVNVTWYSWVPTIGSVSQNEAAYYYMMQYLSGGTLTAICSSSGSPAVYTCPFIEGNGILALWVWTPSESGTSYTVPSGYTDYRDLGGGTTSITGGQTITIGTEPFMLEI